MYAERLLYLPMIGIGLLLGAGSEALARRAPKPALAWTLVGALLVANFAAVQVRNLDWRTSDGLYLSDIETGSDCAIVQANAAVTWFQRGDPVRAEAFARTALDLYQPYPFALSILATSLDRQGRSEEAEQRFRTALQQTTAWEVVADYARFLARHQRWDEGIRMLDQQRQRDPHNEEIQKLLAQLRYQQDRARTRSHSPSP